MSKHLEKQIQKSAEVLVTGGTGFIGSALVKKLCASGFRTRVITRSANSATHLPDQTLIQVGDIREPAALTAAIAGVSTVYHCAAAMQGDMTEVHSTIVDGTSNLLSSIELGEVKKLIYVSSLGIIDYSVLTNGSTLDEGSAVEAQPSLRGVYTKSKKEAEDLVWDFKKKHHNIKVIIVRPGLVYGRSNNPILKNAGVMLGRTLLSFGLGNRQLGLIHVINLSNFLVQLNSKDFPEAHQGPIHLVDREQPTIRQYICYERQFSSRKIRVLYLPIVVWKFVFKLIDLTMWAIRKKSQNLNYRFHSNSKTLHYKSRFLDQNSALSTELSLDEAIKDAVL